MSQGPRRPALFLDRDGTLNREVDFAHRAEDLALVPGAAAVVKAFSEAGYLLFIVTNQSGIARGYFPETDFHEFNRLLVRQLTEKGGRIDGIFWCPHHPDFTGDCDCRKPKPGLLLQAQTQFDIDWYNSLLIGDATRDVIAAEAAGVTGYLFDGPDLYEFSDRSGILPVSPIPDQG